MSGQTLISYLESFPARGDRSALFYKTGFRTLRLSYRELYDLACRISNYLEQRGLKKGDRLILWGANSPEWVGVFLGCLIRGVISVPLDIRGTLAFTEKVFRFTEAALLVCDRTKSANLVTEHWIDFESLRKEAERLPPGPTSGAEVKPSDIAEILFTSGTTGEPKGVVLTHENIFSNVESLRILAPEFRKNNKWLSVLPLSHIFEQTAGLWLPFAHGASITYLKVLNAGSIFGSLQDDEIMTAAIVPRLLGLMQGGILREAKRQGKENIFYFLLHLANRFPMKVRRLLFPALARKFGKFKYFIVGGATLEPELERFWERVGVPLLQGYGLSETSPVISCNQPAAHRSGSIGKVLPGVEVRLGPDKEIQVRGKSIFSGYYRGPEKTGEVFEGDWFKTGDLGEFDRDGFLYFRGRKKDVLVTSEGLNVYPDDLEAVLQAVKGVKDCCVLGVPKEGRENIHAALILEDPSLDLKTVIDRANAHLADYQKIQSFSLWPGEDFPRTATMKVKKNEVLRILQETRAPATAEKGKEKKTGSLYLFLARLAKMKPEEIRPEACLGDDLGLSSLDRVELAAMIEEEFHLDVDDSALLAGTRVAEIETLIRTKAHATQEKEIPRWPMHPWVRTLRKPLQDFFIFPIFRYFCRLKVEGLENLRDLPCPVIFIANHASYFDAPSIFLALPRRILEKIAPATWRGFFDAPASKPWLRLWKGFEFYFASAGFNSYLFDPEKGIKKSMEHTGWLLDRGYNILLFPEGARTRTGRMEPFKPGIGMMASVLNVLVVPVGIKGLFEILPVQRNFPRRGEVTVRFGKPIFFSGESHPAIAKRLEQEIARLVL
ncbi:MAG: AMP-binding protein [Candidatus Omnitrophota bacterium]